MSLVRPVLVAACCAALVACSAAPSNSASSSPLRSASTAPSAAAAVDPCTLLNAAELATLVGDRAGDPEHGTTGGLPHCRWRTGRGAYVQTTAVTSPEWAKALPDVERSLEAAGLVKDPQMAESIRRAAARVTAGEELDPAEACALFSQTLALQGQPAGSTSLVVAFPTRDKAQGVTGQGCARGRFTTVLVYDIDGVDADAIVPAVTALLPVLQRAAGG